MAERRRIFLLILIMIAVSLTVISITIFTLYNTALDGERERLVVTARSQARLIEAVARFDRVYSTEDLPGGSAEATLSQISDAHEHYTGFGETGEFVLARREGDNIVFLLSHRYGGLGEPRPVPYDSPLAEPMRRALSGKSGTVVGPDYRGVTVMAAYEPVDVLDLGIVAKIDMSEIRAPFLTAMVKSCGLGILVVIAGTALFVRISNPILRRVEERASVLEKTNDELEQEIEDRKQIAAALQKARDEIELRVDERTAELTTAYGKLQKEIEEREASGKALAESENRYRSLFDNMMVGVAYCKIILDERNRPVDFMYLEINASFERLTGLKREDVVGKKVTEAIPGIEDAHPELFEIYGNVATTGETAKFEIFFEPLEMWLSVSAYSPEKGYFVAVFDDITEHRAADERMQKDKDMLQAVFDGISDPLILLDRDMRIKVLNNAAKSYYHISESRDVIDRCCFTEFRGQSVPCDGCDIPAAMLGSDAVSLERIGFSDKDRAEEVYVYPLEKSESYEGAAIIRISDVTEAKTLREQVLQNEKLASLGFLVSGIAHEINNPNNFITFNIPILKDYLQELMPIIDAYAEEHEDYSLFGMSYPEFRKDLFNLLDNVAHGSDRINMTVSGLREFVRKSDKSQRQQVDPKVVIEKSISLCRGKIKRMVKSFETDIPDDLPWIMTDPSAVEQVLVNLCINAAQAADKTDSWVKVKASLEDRMPDHLVLEVSDNGSGMDEETRRRIFEPFFTTKGPQSGTGLGLTVCHTLIEGLNGRIEVESNPGDGSTFRVLIPGLDRAVSDRETIEELT